MTIKFAVVKAAGKDVGKIRSVHRHWQSAFNACPATFYTVKRVSTQAKVGEFAKGRTTEAEMIEAIRAEMIEAIRAAL